MPKGSKKCQRAIHNEGRSGSTHLSHDCGSGSRSLETQCYHNPKVIVTTVVSGEPPRASKNVCSKQTIEGWLLGAWRLIESSLQFQVGSSIDISHSVYFVGKVMGGQKPKSWLNLLNITFPLQSSFCRSGFLGVMDFMTSF